MSREGSRPRDAWGHAKISTLSFGPEAIEKRRCAWGSDLAVLTDEHISTLRDGMVLTIEHDDHMHYLIHESQMTATSPEIAEANQVIAALRELLADRDSEIDELEIERDALADELSEALDE